MPERPAGDFLKVPAFPWKLGRKLFIIVAWRFASTKLSYAPETEHDYDSKIISTRCVCAKHSALRWNGAAFLHAGGGSPTQIEFLPAHR